MAASILGTAVLAQQGRDAGQAQGEAASRVAAAKGSADKAPTPETKQPPDVDPKAADIKQRVKELEDLLERTYSQQELQRKTEHIHELLARKYALDLPEGSTLEQLLKAMKSATSSKDDPGIPIFVDPLGLQQAGQTMESIVDLKRGGTLADVLQRAVRLLQLGYDVRDGFLCIDSRMGIVESKLARVEEKLDRIMNALGKQGSRP